MAEGIFIYWLIFLFLIPILYSSVCFIYLFFSSFFWCVFYIKHIDQGVRRHRFYSEHCCCCCLVAKSCPTLCHPLDCSPPGSSVHSISQAGILEWVAISFSGDLPDPGIQPAVPVWQASPALVGRFLLLSHLGSHYILIV